jgi:hypothetical protein
MPPVVHQTLASYSYDSSAVSGTQLTKGRLTDEKSYAGSTLVSERQPYSYDPVGRILNENQYVYFVSSGGRTYSPAYRYDLAGNVIASTDGATPTQAVNTQFPCTLPSTIASTVGSWTTLALVNCFDSGGRLNSVTSNWSNYPTGLYNVSAFGPLGPTNWTLGPVLNVTQGYNNRLWVNSISATGQMP